MALMPRPFCSLGRSLLGALVILIPQLHGSVVFEHNPGTSGGTLIIGGDISVGGTPGAISIQPFLADLTLTPGPSNSSATPLSISRAVFHLPNLQPSGSPAPLATIQSPPLVVRDSRNLNRFEFGNISSPPLDPRQPDPAEFPENRPPVALNPSLPCTGETPILLPASLLAVDHDGDPVTIRVSSLPKWGMLAVQDSGLTYIPFGAYPDGDTFSVVVRDGRGGQTFSTVTLTDPIVRFAGSYSGTIGEIGSLNALLNTSGLGTVQVRVNRKRYVGVVQFPQTGSVTMTLSSSVPETISVTLELLESPNPVIRLTMTNDGEPIVVDCPQLTPEQFVNDYVGQFNLVLSPESQEDDGYAVVKVQPTGAVRITGCLPNDKPWSAGTSLTSGGKVPLEVLNGNGRLIVSGELLLPHITKGTDTVEAGQSEWIRPSQTTTLQAWGGRFEPETRRNRNNFGELRTKADFSIVSPLVSNIVHYFQFQPGGPVIRKSVHGEDMRLSIDGFNRVTQLRPVLALTSIKLKRDGRFSGLYEQGDSSPDVEFHGIFYSPYSAIGRVRGGRGFVRIDRLN